MKFTIALQHRRTRMIFLIVAEKDGIYIAWPRKDRGRSENIFLIKPEEQWIGDSDDKSLVKKIGKEIDAACRQNVKQKRKAA